MGTQDSVALPIAFRSLVSSVGHSRSARSTLEPARGNRETRQWAENAFKLDR